MRRRADGLATANRQKEQFLAMLSHELRNPMAPITHAVEVLDRLTPEDASAQQALGVIRRQSRQLSRMVDDLLDATRVASGKVRLVRERVDLVDLARRAVEAVHPSFEKRSQAIALDTPSDEVAVDADPARIVQVLTNLLGNAAKYTDPGGRIELEVTRQGARAIARVRDNGVGIAPELMPHLFDMFVQDDRHFGRAEGGLGIGLALARNLASLHDGTLWAESEGPDRGSTFTLELPLAASARDGTPGPVVQSGPAVDASAITVLVIDDNLDAADSLALLLRLLSYTVHVAYDGQSALDEAQLHPPDVVLLDLALPDMSGYQVLSEMKAALGAPVPIFVALTGFGGNAVIREAEAAGFDHHCLKPIEPSALEALLAKIGRELVR
jgi:CheY-like chemotaxis protein/anti-sigma regulatory factor (Ser/Thr protein kinase)